MFIAVLNCWRRQLLVSVVEAVSKVGSRSTTSTRPRKPGSTDRCQATEAPMIAPPMMTTS